jgi:hypothetical protein
MKYNICGFSQTELIKHGLDHSDALILQEIKDFYASGRMVTRDIDGKEYFWVKYKMLIDSLPVLGIKSRDAIYRRLMKMVACGVLEHQTVKRNGTYSYFRFGKSMPALLWSGGATSEPTGYGSNTTRGTDEKSEQKTLLTNNPSNKDTTAVAGAPVLEEKENKPVQSPLLSQLKDVSSARREAFEDWLEYKKELKNAYKPKGFATLVKQWSKFSDDEFRYAVDRSMANGWKGLFVPEGSAHGKAPQAPLPKSVLPPFSSDW